METLHSDWFTPRVLAGIDAAADGSRVQVELLGQTRSDLDALARRLERSRPDVLICLSGRDGQGLIIRDAQRLGIPVLAAGHPSWTGPASPCVAEDNLQGMALAVRHLAEAGHTPHRLAASTRSSAAGGATAVARSWKRRRCRASTQTAG